MEPAAGWMGRVRHPVLRLPPADRGGWRGDWGPDGGMVVFGLARFGYSVGTGLPLPPARPTAHATVLNSVGQGMVR